MSENVNAPDALPSVDRLSAMVTVAAVNALSELWASPDGPAIVEAGLAVVRRAERSGKASPDVASVAGAIFAGWPGMGPNGHAVDSSVPVYPPLESRLDSARKAASLALRRCRAVEIGQLQVTRSGEVSLDALAGWVAGGQADDIPAGDALATVEADATRARLGRAMPWRAPDALPSRTDRDLASLASGASLADGVPADVLVAVARPLEGRKGSAGAGVNRAAVLRALGWRDKGKGGATDRAALDACLEAMEAAGARVLAALDMARVAPAAVRTGDASAPGTVAVAARMTVREGGVRALPAVCPVYRAVPSAPRWDDATLALADAMAARPGTVKGACAVWQPWVTRGPVFPLGSAPAGRPGRTVASAGPSRVGTVAGRPDFLADDSAHVSGGPAVSLPAVPGVTPGSKVGQGAPAGQGQAFRRSAPRKRSRDGGVGSPMI